MEDVKGATSVIVSCLNTKRLNQEAYIRVLNQGYLPPCSIGFLRRQWMTPECIQRSAKWFTELAMSHRMEADLDEAYLARVGFALAFLSLKHVLEYKWIELPGDVKDLLSSAPVDLDFVVGNFWPTLLSMGLGAYAGHNLRNVRRFTTPFAVFGMVSDVLYTYGFTRTPFTVTGFGRFVDRLVDHVLAFDRITDFQDVVKSLVAVSKVHRLALQDLTSFLNRDWYTISKSLHSQYVQYGGLESLYTEEDVRLDVVHFIITAIDHYNGLLDASIKRLLGQYLSAEHLSRPRDTITTVAQRFFAKRVRIW